MYIEDEPQHLQQGDIFRRFERKELPRCHPEEAGFITLTYTCDLANPKDLHFICFCPIFELDILINRLLEIYKDKSPENIKMSIKNKIHEISNNIYRFHFFLSPNSEFKGQPAYADLGQIYNIPVDYMQLVLKKRKLSLSNPWIEKLGFMIGHLFNRVATENIDQSLTEHYINNNKILEEFLQQKYENL